jgi:hypothetical protein
MFDFGLCMWNFESVQTRKERPNITIDIATRLRAEGGEYFSFFQSSKIGSAVNPLSYSKDSVEISPVVRRTGREFDY